MLPNILFHPFLEFLVEVDRFISTKVKDRRNSHENGVTDDFLWCLDGATRPPEGLRFPIATLKERARSLVGDEFPIGVLLKAEGYSQIFEGGVSQADYGLNINFRDTSEDLEHDYSEWSATYFMQSKVAKRAEHPLTWNEKARFNATAGQADAIDRLRQLYGSRGLWYHLYCPHGALDLSPESELYAKICNKDLRIPGWAYYQTAGLWLAPGLPGTISDLFSSAAPPIPWAMFVLAHFFEIPDPLGHRIETDSLFAAQQNAEFEFRKNLFQRRRPEVLAALRAQQPLSATKARALDSYFEAQEHRTVTMEINFPTLDYEHKMTSQPDPPASDPEEPGGTEPANTW